VCYSPSHHHFLSYFRGGLSLRKEHAEVQWSFLFAHVPVITLSRNLPPFAALDSVVFSTNIWPTVRHNRQFFPKGSQIMSEGSLATGIWLITHGCATRSIASASDHSKQKQLVIETLVPGQSAGWEELALLMRSQFAHQVSCPLFTICSFIYVGDAGAHHELVQRRRLERRAHNICSRKRNQSRLFLPGIFVRSSSIRPTCSRCICSNVS
jgi:hypothetical protein